MCRIAQITTESCKFVKFVLTFFWISPPLRFFMNSDKTSQSSLYQLISCSLHVLSRSLLNTLQWRPQLQKINCALITPEGSDCRSNFTCLTDYSNFPDTDSKFSWTQEGATSAPMKLGIFWRARFLSTPGQYHRYILAENLF